MKAVKKIAKKLIKIMLVLGILAVMAVFFINMYVTGTAEKRMYSEESILPRDADCIIVLGAGLKPDGTPNHMLRDRLDLAINLYEAGLIDYTSYKSLQRNYPEFNKSFIPDNASISRNGIIMTVEAIAFYDSRMVVIFSFANEEGNNFIQKDGDYDWKEITVKLDGEKFILYQTKWGKYDEEKGKLYCMYSAQRDTARIPDGEMLNISVRGCFIADEWNEEYGEDWRWQKSLLLFSHSCGGL